MPENAFPREPFRILALWLHEATDAKTIGEGLERLLKQSTFPDDVEAAWRWVRSCPLQDAVSAAPAPSITDAVNALDWAFNDDRDAEVFWSRIPPSRSTLDEIAAKLGVTRQRVSQLQSRAETAVRAALQSKECTLLRWRIWRLAQRMGRAAPSGAAWVQAALEDLVHGAPPEWHDRLRALALWYAGPYHHDSSNWLYRGTALSKDDVIRHHVDSQGRIDTHAVQQVLAEIGVVPEAQKEWMRHSLSLRTIDGVTYLWEGAVTQKALIVLSAIGAPTTAEVIVENIGEGHDVRATRLRMLSDRRFMRVDRYQIALRCWGMDEYTGIVDEITEELERRGGDADLRDVVSSVAIACSVGAASVTALTSAPRFVVANGRIRLRRSGEVYQVRRELIEEAGCYLISQNVSAFRIAVDEHLLRGSGRRIPEGLGAWLGVLPGGRRYYSVGKAHQLQVSWPDSAPQGPSIGSLRPAALAAGAQEGDFMILVFNRATAAVQIDLVRAESLRALDVEERLALVTGLRRAARTGPTEELLAIAVGASGVSALRERLRRRGEEMLIELLPRSDHTLDGALDRLRSIL